MLGRHVLGADPVGRLDPDLQEGRAGASASRATSPRSGRSTCCRTSTTCSAARRRSSSRCCATAGMACIEEDGAQVICMGSTTMHQAVPYLQAELPVPVVNPGPLTLQAGRARPRPRPDAVEEGVSVPERPEARDAGGDDGGGGGERAGGGRGLSAPARGRPRRRGRAVRRRARGRTLQLADLGAEVIKIEDPRVGRRRRALRAAVPGGRGLALLRDLQPQQEVGLARPAAPATARPVLEDLVRASDAVYSNLRGDQPAQARAHLRAS